MGDFKQRIQQLSEKQQHFLAEKLKTVQAADAVSESKGPQRIVAYVVGESKLDMSELQAAVREQLPDYMVPSEIIQVDEFQRLPNGKIDLSALSSKASMAEPTATAISFAGPRNATEQQLATIWEEVLNFSPIGIHDNFFEIGGDSILSIQIIAKARKHGLHLAPNQLFDYQTIGELAAVAQPIDHSLSDSTTSQPDNHIAPETYKPEDFPEVGLDQDDLDQLFDQLGG